MQGIPCVAVTGGDKKEWILFSRKQLALENVGDL